MRTAYSRRSKFLVCTLFVTPRIIDMWTQFFMFYPVSCILSSIILISFGFQINYWYVTTGKKLLRTKIFSSYLIQYIFRLKCRYDSPDVAVDWPQTFSTVILCCSFIQQLIGM